MKTTPALYAQNIFLYMGYTQSVSYIIEFCCNGIVHLKFKNVIKTRAHETGFLRPNDMLLQNDQSPDSGFSFLILLSPPRSTRKVIK